MSTIIRIRTKERMERFQVNLNMTIKELKQLIDKKINETNYDLSIDEKRKEIITDLKITLRDCGLGNGSILYIVEKNKENKEIKKIDYSEVFFINK